MAEHVAWGEYRQAVEAWERIMGPVPQSWDREANDISPLFLEWMMGFPQGWTEGISIAQRVKALGNAVVPAQARLAISLLR